MRDWSMHIVSSSVASSVSMNLRSGLDSFSETSQFTPLFEPIGYTTAKPFAFALALNCVANGCVPAHPSSSPWKSKTNGIGVDVPGAWFGGTVMVYRRLPPSTASVSASFVTGPRVVTPHPGDAPMAPGGGSVVTGGGGVQAVTTMAVNAVATTATSDRPNMLLPRGEDG